MNNLIMTNTEYRFACIVWEHEPITSPLLAKLCEEKLGWKRTTMYIVLKKLYNRGILMNQSTIVTSILSQSQVQNITCKSILNDRFNDKLPQFIATYLNGRQISLEEAEQIKAMIGSHVEIC